VKARLVEIEGGRRVRATPVAAVPITIGRDPNCDIVVPSGRVSRAHARVELLGGVHHLVDLDSANGTQYRGRNVAGRVVLEPGDEFQIAEEVTFRYLPEREVPWLAIGAALAVAAVVIAALLLFGTGDPIWNEAVRLAGEAVDADAKHDYALAQKRLRAAVGLLLREGRLDDVPRSEVVEVAMARLGQKLGGGVDLDSLFARSHDRSEPAPVEVAGECRLDSVSARDFDSCLRRRIELVMIGLRQDPKEVPEQFYPEVARRLSRERAFLAGALGRVDRYRDMMSEELKRAYMPPLLHYLACIESGYRTDARSPAGALGLWQFMPGTARDYGLRVAGNLDERGDARRSTTAAARYLRSLAFEFGGESLMLVLASYNHGENAVRRALKRLEDPYADRSYWALVKAGYLPDETADYVARYVAAAVAGEAGLPSEAVLADAGY
jgi:transglycosylase-like protein with SLT domain/FHA domain-containing protein